MYYICRHIGTQEIPSKSQDKIMPPPKLRLFVHFEETLISLFYWCESQAGILFKSFRLRECDREVYYLKNGAKNSGFGSF